MKRNSTFIIAELSGNHNRDLAHTKNTMYAMKESGADAVKLQTYRPDSLTLDVDNDEFGPRTSGLWKGQKPYDVFAQGALPYEWHEEIFDYAKTLELVCFSSPFDIEAVNLLEGLGNPIYKVASFEIGHVPLLERIAQTHKPVIISTGIATLGEIESALSIFGDDTEVSLLKCTSAYPTPYSEVNLRSMRTLKEVFGLKVGLSDHTLGDAVAIGAVALGASIVEKHFILDKAKGGIDAEFSMQPSEFRQMVNSIRIIEDALGDSVYMLSHGSQASRNKKRTIYVAEDVKRGDILTQSNVQVVRAAKGMDPALYNQLIGKKFTRPMMKGDPLNHSDIAE